MFTVNNRLGALRQWPCTSRNIFNLLTFFTAVFLWPGNENPMVQCVSPHISLALTHTLNHHLSDSSRHALVRRPWWAWQPAKDYRLVLTGTWTVSKGHQESQFLQPFEYCSISSRVITENSFSVAHYLYSRGPATRKEIVLLLLIKYKEKHRCNKHEWKS